MKKFDKKTFRQLCETNGANYFQFNENYEHFKAHFKNFVSTCITKIFNAEYTKRGIQNYFKDTKFMFTILSVGDVPITRIAKGIKGVYNMLYDIYSTRANEYFPKIYSVTVDRITTIELDNEYLILPIIHTQIKYTYNFKGVE